MNDSFVVRPLAKKGTMRRGHNAVFVASDSDSCPKPVPRRERTDLIRRSWKMPLVSETESSLPSPAPPTGGVLVCEESAIAADQERLRSSTSWAQIRRPRRPLPGRWLVHQEAGR
ncbi:hypothetical protein GWI33_004090 [Rhynchophorus ferrugineus]|uniref:Uncharacterized protein n=1 Tax=Rhynchophorus ferrugineus TaxID=354439 RepID=A0A834IJ75_RHYFE|nr:hypothetical protein GWI33_004090 [Rhynchophorus ferrugineus]